MPSVSYFQSDYIINTLNLILGGFYIISSEIKKKKKNARSIKKKVQAFLTQFEILSYHEGNDDGIPGGTNILMLLLKDSCVYIICLYIYIYICKEKERLNQETL